MRPSEAGGSKLDIGSIELGAGVGAHAKGVEPYVDVAINKGVLTLGIGTSDGFLAKILPSGPIQTNFDLGVSWSSSGLRFTGSGALSVAIPLHVTLGPFDLENLYLVGGGSMPSIGSSNITLTLAALCFKTAGHLITQLRHETAPAQVAAG